MGKLWLQLWHNIFQETGNYFKMDQKVCFTCNHGRLPCKAQEYQNACNCICGYATTSCKGHRSFFNSFWLVQLQLLMLSSLLASGPCRRRVISIQAMAIAKLQAKMPSWLAWLLQDVVSCQRTLHSSYSDSKLNCIHIKYKTNVVLQI